MLVRAAQEIFHARNNVNVITMLQERKTMKKIIYYRGFKWVLQLIYWYDSVSKAVNVC